MRFFTFLYLLFLNRIQLLFAACIARRPCVICKKPAADCICPLCVARFVGNRLYNPADSCRRCGRPLVSRKNYCTDCRELPPLSAENPALLFPYKGWGRLFMDEWKLYGNRACVFFAAEHIAKNVMCCFPGSCIVPVPPRRGKMLKKGWDQIQDLSVVLEYRYGMTVCRCLRRRKSAVQKTLDKEQRRKNALSSFFAAAPVPDCAVIIDDVMTTGATLEACAAVLKNAGSRTVTGCILFYD